MKKKNDKITIKQKIYFDFLNILFHTLVKLPSMHELRLTVYL